MLVVEIWTPAVLNPRCGIQLCSRTILFQREALYIIRIHSMRRLSSDARSVLTLEITRRNLRPPTVVRACLSQGQIHRGNHDGNEIAALSNWENFPWKRRVAFSPFIAHPFFVSVGLCERHPRIHFAAPSFFPFFFSMWKFFFTWKIRQQNLSPR